MSASDAERRVRRALLGYVSFGRVGLRESDVRALLAVIDGLREERDELRELYEELSDCRWIREDGSENKLAVTMANLKRRYAALHPPA